MRPWGVHTVSDIYSAGCQAGLPDGSYVAAVAEPYTANRLVAAWWVLTGRAYALKWPKPADLERTLGWAPKIRQPMTGTQATVNQLKSLHKAISVCDVDPAAEPVQHPWGGAF